MINPDSSKINQMSLVVFTLDDGHYALKLDAVNRIIQSVEITVLPTAPDAILGVINFRGNITPVFNIRKRFHLPEKDNDPDNRLIIAHTKTRNMALPVDMVLDVIETPQETVTSADALFPAIDHVSGVLKMASGLVVIYDFNGFLSLEEEKNLDSALNKIEGIK